jgi:hypothetical protein
MLGRVRRVASALVALALISPSLAASAAEGASAPTPAAVEPVVSRRGVAVIAIGEGASDATWPVALAVYGDEALRPRLQDRDARVLAGAEPAKDAPKETKELAELRAQVRGDDTASLLLLREIARRTSTAALVLVWPKSDAASPPTPTQARLYDAADDSVDPSLHREGSAGWSALVTTLRGRYVKPDAAPSSASGATKGELPRASPAKGGSAILSSPWFWGAVAVAVLGAVVMVASSKGSDPSSTGGLRIEWGK